MVFREEEKRREREREGGGLRKGRLDGLMWAPLLSRVSLAEAPGWRQPAGSVVLEGQAEVAGGDWLGWVLRLQGGVLAGGW